MGGMSSKLEAVKIAASSGIPSVIASGASMDSLIKSAAGVAVGTFFPAHGVTLKARQRWIAYGARVRGALIVDNGAKNALTKNGKSLLSVGITRLKGNFNKNETVSIADEAENEFARGKVNFSSTQLQSSIGMRLKQEVIHRDNMVLL